MTGTPAPKNLLNLWSQMYLLDEGLALGSNFYRFRNKYFEATDWNKYNWDIKEGAANIIQEAIGIAEAADYDVVKTLTQKYIHRSKYGVGSGKADELKYLVKELDANIILIDEKIGSVQIYNLAKSGEQPGFLGIGMYDVDDYYNMIKKRMIAVKKDCKK